ncbi:MAG: hypothetical protein K9L30_16510 [Desulfobacterales bacterium]|nr:hypothetical protein [Desulfobacterales bacterium]
MTDPKGLMAKDFKFNGIDKFVPGCRYSEIMDAEGFGGFGLYFMPPGAQTTVFSLESEDDGTADEYYGPCFEFYFLLSGEITMYWGKDAAKLKKGEGNEILLKAGDFGCWEKEWKFAAKNTGELPVTFFWGLGEPPEGIVERLPDI